MWLLDENLDVNLLAFLRSQEVKCDNVRGRGWRGLQNGDLVKVAWEAGFRCLLTRDVDFPSAAAGETGSTASTRQHPFLC